MVSNHRIEIRSDGARIHYPVKRLQQSDSLWVETSAKSAIEALAYNLYGISPIQRGSKCSKCLQFQVVYAFSSGKKRESLK